MAVPQKEQKSYCFNGEQSTGSINIAGLCFFRLAGTQVYLGHGNSKHCFVPTQPRAFRQQRLSGAQPNRHRPGIALD